MPALEDSASPPLANPVPSRFNSMISFVFSLASQTIHCFAGLTRVSVHVLQVVCPQGLAKNISELLDNFFLHDGHIGSASSSFAFASTGVESGDLDDADTDAYVVKTTGVRFFKESSCAGFPPRHVV